MAETSKNKIYYNDNENSVADVLADMKKMAESTDKAIENSKYNDAQIKKDISDAKKEQALKDAEQDNKIIELQNEKAKLEKELKEAQEDFYQASIRGQASGEYIHVEDSSNCRAKIGIGGNHEQKTRAGYNKLNMSNAKGGTSGGITCVINEDGSYQFKGTATTTDNGTVNVWFLGYYNSKAPTLFTLEAGTYYINDVLLFSGIKKLNEPLKKIYTFTSEVNITGVRAMSATPGQTYNEVKYPIIAKSNKELTWEQYGAMPSLDYPSKIETVGDNLNLLDIDKTTYDLTINLQKEGEYLKGNNVNIIRIGTFNDSRPQIEEKLKSGNYTISYEVEANSNVTILNLFLCVIYEDDTQENVGSGKSYSLEEGTKQKVFWTLNVQKNVKKMGIVSYLSNSCDIIVSKVKIEKGLIATPYSPYGMGSVEIKISNNDNTQSQTAIMPVQKEMLEGDYVADVEHHEWKKLTLTGNENIKLNTAFANVFNIEIPKINIMNQQVCLCNIAKGVVYNTALLTIQDNIIMTASLNKIVYKSTKFSSLSEFKTYLQNQYEEGTPVIVYYKLAEPINLELTDEQKAVAKELNNARTYKNVTNITTDSKAILSLDYAKDLETLLNNTQALAVNNASEGV